MSQVAVITDSTASEDVHSTKTRSEFVKSCT